MKHAMIIALVVVLLCGLGTLEAKTKRGLGVHFGTVSANGFSYRQFSGYGGFQGTLGAITTDDGDPFISYDFYSTPYGSSSISQFSKERETNLNFGLNYLYSLADNPTGRFYVFGGGSYLLSILKGKEAIYRLTDPGTGHYELDPSHPVRSDKHYQGSFYLGGGLGFELNLGRGFRWAIELPLTVNEDTEFTMYIPQTGLYYFF